MCLKKTLVARHCTLQSKMANSTQFSYYGQGTRQVVTSSIWRAGMLKGKQCCITRQSRKAMQPCTSSSLSNAAVSMSSSRIVRGYQRANMHRKLTASSSTESSSYSEGWSRQRSTPSPLKMKLTRSLRRIRTMSKKASSSRSSSIKF